MIGDMQTTQKPEEIETQIAQTRASLDAKIHELERRLSPREQMARMRSQLNPAPYLGLLAAGAVAAGAALAYRGWCRFNSNGNGAMAGTGAAARMDDPVSAEVMGE